MSDNDGIALTSMAHPPGTFWDRVRGWLHDKRVRLFGFKGTETAWIEIREKDLKQ